MQFKKEIDFQKFVCAYLDIQIGKKGLVTYFSVPNGVLAGGNNRYAIMNSMKSSGLKRGVSDLILVFKSYIIFLELKNDKGKLSEDQIAFMDTINNQTDFMYKCITPKTFNILTDYFNN